MGNTCKSMADSFQCMTKSTTIKKKVIIDIWKKKRLPGEIPITSDVQMIPPLRQKSKRTKEPLDENERGELKICLKTNIQKTKIMASGPMSSLQIDGETMETVADFIFGGSKITADGDCSHEIKRCLLLRRKAMISPEY